MFATVCRRIYIGIKREFESMATNGTRDRNNALPDVRSLIAPLAAGLNEFLLFRTRLGILLAQITPARVLSVSTSSICCIVRMVGTSGRDAAYKIDDGVPINWPEKSNP